MAKMKGAHSFEESWFLAKEKEKEKREKREGAGVLTRKKKVEKVVNPNPLLFDFCIRHDLPSPKILRQHTIFHYIVSAIPSYLIFYVGCTP